MFVQVAAMQRVVSAAHPGLWDGSDKNGSWITAYTGNTRSFICYKKEEKQPGVCDDDAMDAVAANYGIVYSASADDSVKVWEKGKAGGTHSLLVVLSSSRWCVLER